MITAVMEMFLMKVVHFLDAANKLISENFESLFELSLGKLHRREI